MDLSAVIFVVLALAWAVYLIPKALKHHDEMASDRLVEAHSDRVRVLRRTSSTTTVETVAHTVAESVDEEPLVVRGSRRQRRRAARRAAALARPAQRPVTLRAARQAARRRRRVLLALVLVLAAVAGLAYAAVVPAWSPVVPAVLVVAFLVVARLSVRRTRLAAVPQRRPVAAVVATDVVSDAAAPAPASSDEVDIALHAPADPEAAAMLADDGALWDPLPLTLPTYVNKARARRTVRTIELTGMQSSGHSEADTALAREAEADAAARATADAAARRRVAGA